MAKAALRQLHPPPHVFIGCSSAALPLGNKIKEKLETNGDIVATVWNKQLLELGGIILDNLLRYVSSFDFSVLVLSADDFTSSTQGGEATAAPRDNVIFEMGLFMEAKGRERVLVVREEGAKMPADIGGGIYLSLRDRDDIKPIETKLLEFVEKRV